MYLETSRTDPVFMVLRLWFDPILRGGICKFDSCSNLMKGVGGFMSPKDFYDRLMVEIERKGMKPSEFSDKLGFSRTTIYNFKTAFPTVENLVKISNFLNVSVDYLLGRTAQSDIAEDVKNQPKKPSPDLVAFVKWLDSVSVKMVSIEDM